MKLSQMAFKTLRQISAEDPSLNAQLLQKAGYVNRLMAGVYTYLPLGLRVLTKIERIVREEMDALGAAEILMPALHPSENWRATGRWDGLDVLFKLKGAGDRDLALGATHEEIVTPLMAGLVESYKDLPQAFYQIQTKFRNEPRAKSGVMRGREFRMKDLYSFHTTAEDLDAYYEKVTVAYHKIYARLGIGDRTLLTAASGGTFSKFSHEFQTLTDAGEDSVYLIPGSKLAINKEIIDDEEALAALVPGYRPGDNKTYSERKACEVGNIFKLMTKYSQPFEATFTDHAGAKQTMIMGCYGLGTSRLMGVITECLADEKGLIWPEEIAPYQVHLLHLGETRAAAASLYHRLVEAGIEVLWDDREAQNGVKFNDADLIGIPNRLVVSEKTLAKSPTTVEWKKRTSPDLQLVELEYFIEQVKKSQLDQNRIPV